MLNRKSIERALARAAGHQDESVVARLALFAPALLKAADLRAQLAAEAPEWTDEEIEAARLGKETLLSLRPVRIDSERFLHRGGPSRQRRDRGRHARSLPSHRLEALCVG